MEAVEAVATLVVVAQVTEEAQAVLVVLEQQARQIMAVAAVVGPVQVIVLALAEAAL